jgi:hypothetical protein
MSESMNELLEKMAAVILERNARETPGQLLETMLKEQIDHASTDLGKRVEDGKSALDKRIDDLNKRFEDVNKGVGVLQWIFGLLAVVLTLGAGVGAIVGGLRLADMQQTITNFQKTQGEVDKLKTDLVQTNDKQSNAIKDVSKQAMAQQTLFTSHTEFFVEVLWENCQQNLEGVSLDNLDPKAFDAIRRNNEIIARILAASDTFSSGSEEIKIIRSFQKVNDAILAYGHFLDSRKDPAKATEALKTLEEAWKHSPTDGLVRGGNYALMEQQLDAYWQNGRGVIRPSSKPRTVSSRRL